MYNSTDRIGWGPAYQYNCIHSGLIKTSGDISTTWYNYSLATAGTIIDKNTTSSNPASNITTATESVCPKGWTLPSKVQIDSQTDIAVFSPVLGGSYANGNISSESERGSWWGSGAYNGALRRRLFYDNGSLITGSGSIARRDGIYIRCVQKS